MYQTIQLDSTDDIATIRARIENAELSYLILAVPRDCRALDNERGLQLVRRAAEDAGAHVALVVHDDDVRERAQALGFPVFTSLVKAQRTRWKMEPLSPGKWQDASGGRLYAERKSNVPSAPPETTAAPSARALELAREYQSVIVTIAFALIVLCIAAFLLVPAAKVRLVPSPVAIIVPGDVIADPTIQQISSSTRTVPARRLSRDIVGAAQIRTTTQRQVPNAPSTGTVTFTNQRTEETIIPPNTIVKTSAGVPIRFTTTTTTTLPAGVGARVDAPIQALEPGPSGNVKELAINTIEGSLAIAVRVINTKPTVSGTNKPVRVVTADDKKKLEAQLIQQLAQQAEEALKADLKPGEFLAPDSVLIDPTDSVYDRAVDEPADVLNLKMNAVAFGIAIDRENLTTMVSAVMQRQMQTGYQLLPDGVSFETSKGGKYQGIAFRLPLRAIGYTSPQLDVGKVSRALQGRTVDDAKSYLASVVAVTQPPEIEVSPVGWNRLPWLGFRIAVFVEPPVVKK